MSDTAQKSPPRASAIYRGWMSHRRTTPIVHEFGYRLFMMYIDLDELDHLFDGRLLWSSRRRNLAWFRRADYLGSKHVPLKTAVADKVERSGYPRPTGPIRMLTQLRMFGACFNPVTFYYCFAPDGVTLETIVAEITNTPWGERYAYVLSPTENLGRAGVRRHRFAKAFHVSPFMPMDHTYEWTFTAPADTTTVHMTNYAGDASVFDATLVLRREEIGAKTLARVLLRHPFMTFRVAFYIYLQALILKVRGAPFFAHPKMTKETVA